MLATSRRAAVGGFHWYFLAVPPPLPEALIGAEPQLYLEQVMGRWAGRVEGAEAITTEAMAAYVEAFTPAVIAASCADYHAGATFDSDLDAADREAGRTIGCPVHALWGDRGRDDANEAFLATWRRWTAPDHDVTGRRCRAATSSPRSDPTCASRSCSRSSPRGKRPRRSPAGAPGGQYVRAGLVSNTSARVAEQYAVEPGVGIGLNDAQTHYAKSGDFHIVYQVFGAGTHDILLVPNWFTNVESSWDVPSFAEFFRSLAALCACSP